ncbi:MAG: RICIN domain-containing protein, partial [Lachnospiraceae bacterium]|nr:RICIN domain-containing protein [Lachnospiraceae bacterium]
MNRLMKKLLAVTLILSMLLSIRTNVQAAALVETGVSNNIYVIYASVGFQMTVDVKGGKTANGTNIQIYKANDSNGQKFYICKESNGWYTIRHAVSDKVLEAADNSAKSGVNVQLGTFSKKSGQYWRFYKAGSDTVYIKNKLGYFLDVAGAKTANGTNVRIYKENRSKGQTFKLAKTAVHPQSLKLSASSSTLVNPGDTLKLSWSAAPYRATKAIYKWTTSNSKVATVSGGVITAKGHGTAVITAQTYNGLKASVKITVIAPTKVTFPLSTGQVWYMSTYVGHGGSNKSAYSAVDIKLKNGKSCRGYDVKAVASGVVVNDTYKTSNGQITIKCSTQLITNNNVVFAPNTWYVTYAHMRNIKVKKGDVVTAGQKIGEVSDVGKASGPHLHLSISHTNWYQTSTNNYAISPYYVNGFV